MSRAQTVTALSLALVAALAGAASSSRARAQQESDNPTPVATVKPAPFEYNVFVLDFTDYSEKDEWKAFLAKNGGNALKADAEFRGYVLNYLAHDGWELVQVVPVKEKLTNLYLRRPRTSNALPQLPEGATQADPDPKTFPNPDARGPRKGH